MQNIADFTTKLGERALNLKGLQSMAKTPRVQFFQRDVQSRVQRSPNVNAGSAFTKASVTWKNAFCLHWKFYWTSQEGYSLYCTL